MEYLRALRAMVRYARALIKDRVTSRLSTLLGQVNVDGQHADADPYGRARRLVAAAHAAFNRRYPADKLEKMARAAAVQTSEHQKGQLLRQIKSTIGVDLTTVSDKGTSERLKRFVAENVALTQSISRKYFSEVESAVLTGVRTGGRATEIATLLVERANVAQSRANMIAKDQVLKLTGELNRSRQQGLGIDSYIWRTAGDNRTRDEHAELEGEEFQWSDPPDIGHPGEDFQCRCYAEPVIPLFETEE